MAEIVRRLHFSQHSTLPSGLGTWPLRGEGSPGYRVDMTPPPIKDLTTLIVPLDGFGSSVRAVPVAGRLAQRLGMNIRLLSVVSGADDIGPRSALVEDVAAYLLPEHETETEIVVASDAEHTVAAATASDGLLCMATAASLRLHHAHFGSIAEHVARETQQPMFVVGPRMMPTPGTPTQRVIVPIDGSELSELALPVAADLASALSLAVWVVSVIDEHVGGGPGEANYVRNRARQLGEDTGVDVSFEVLHGDPAQAIADFVGDDGTAVMTTHGRSGLSRLFAGSVTTGVVARSHRAVMVFRPPEVDS